MSIDVSFEFVLKRFPVKASHLKSLTKAVSWRVVGTLSTALITYFVTHEVRFAIYVSSLEFFAKIVIFYVHERVWENVSLDKKLTLSRSTDE